MYMPSSPLRAELSALYGPSCPLRADLSTGRVVHGPSCPGIYILLMFTIETCLCYSISNNMIHCHNFIYNPDTNVNTDDRCDVIWSRKPVFITNIKK